MTREEAIDILKNTIVRFGRTNGKTAYVEALQMAIKALEEPQWISCSERLPETSDEVLTTYIVNGNHKKRFVETATYYSDDEGYWSSPWDEYRIIGTRVEVVAWMPLPEPWRGDAE